MCADEYSLNILESILTGLIANFVFLIFTIVFGWSVFLIARRRRLLKFFNVAKSKRLIIYLSNIRVMQGGSIGIDGISRSYSGTTVTFKESLRSSLFQSLFNYLVPGLSHQPGLLKYLLVSDVKIEIQPSPTRIEDLDKNSTIITLGSPGYNLASDWTEKNLLPPIRFKDDNRKIYVEGLEDITNTRQAFVQRLYDSKNERFVFYTAGLSELGTVGAVYFLVSNWRNLYKDYKNKSSFSLVIEVNEKNEQDSIVVIRK